MKDKIIT